MREVSYKCDVCDEEVESILSVDSFALSVNDTELPEVELHEIDICSKCSGKLGFSFGEEMDHTADKLRNIIIDRLKIMAGISAVVEVPVLQHKPAIELDNSVVDGAVKEIKWGVSANSAENPIKGLDHDVIEKSNGQ